jgi:hypothetical protein
LTLTRLQRKDDLAPAFDDLDDLDFDDMLGAVPVAVSPIGMATSTMGRRTGNIEQVCFECFE